MPHPNRLINLNVNKPWPQAVKGEGIYIFDCKGNRYLDGYSGALVVNCGHTAIEIVQVMAAQAEKLPFVYRNHFSTPIAEQLAERYCSLTERTMGGVYFTNSSSEAIEAAVKLARVRHLTGGQKGRHKIISRWQSYHGITMGALSWSGITARRADYQPYLKDFAHKGCRRRLLPLAGVLFSADVMATIASGGGAFTASQSNSGHPIGMAAGHAVLDYIQMRGLLENAAEMGTYLGKRLKALQGHPSVGDVRGMGLMWGLETDVEQDIC